ncbi:MAG: glycosyltransferase [Acidobacteriia bacterium]|nr:glycosyltransferase [Terriglobia bacterium]
MSRFLFVMVEAGGNVPAQISIARRLAARGHEVHVLSDRAAESEVLAAGCRFLPFVHAPHNNMRDREADVVRDWESSFPPAQVRRVGERLMFGPASAYARDVLETAERLQPHGIAVDCLIFGAIAGAEKSKVPAAVLVHFPVHPPGEGVTPFGLELHPAKGLLGRLRDRALLSLTRQKFGFGLLPLNAARLQLGLAPLSDVFEQYKTLHRRLILTSFEYDFAPPNLPDKVCYAGPQLDDPEWARNATVPGLEAPGPPLVAVSLGSTYQRQEKPLAAIAEALGRLPVRGFMMLGGVQGLTTAAPPNVIVVRSAPHAAVLPHASAVVCHGGHGTVMKALAHGLPLVVMPIGRDQKDNGARVEVSGAGVALSPSASAGRIADAIRRVLREPGFRSGAQRMAGIIARDVRTDRAVFEMEALAGRPVLVA